IGLITVGVESKAPGLKTAATFSSGDAHGYLGLEVLPHLRTYLDPHSSFFRGARRAHRLEPAPQRLPHAHQDAAVLPDLRPQGGAQRNREGLRIRKRPVRALRRERIG